MAARIEPHISVIYDFVDLDVLRRAVAATRPLRLRLSHLRRWDEAPGMYIEVLDPHGDLAHFRSAVLGPAITEYQPHVTILHRDSIPESRYAEDAWAALRDVVLDTNLRVTELRVYDQLAAAEEVWRETALLRFAEDRAPRDAQTTN